MLPSKEARRAGVFSGGLEGGAGGLGEDGGAVCNQPSLLIEERGDIVVLYNAKSSHLICQTHHFQYFDALVDALLPLGADKGAQRHQKLATLIWRGI